MQMNKIIAQTRQTNFKLHVHTKIHLLEKKNLNPLFRFDPLYFLCMYSWINRKCDLIYVRNRSIRANIAYKNDLYDTCIDTRVSSYSSSHFFYIDIIIFIDLCWSIHISWIHFLIISLIFHINIYVLSIFDLFNNIPIFMQFFLFAIGLQFFFFYFSAIMLYVMFIVSAQSVENLCANENRKVRDEEIEREKSFLLSIVFFSCCFHSCRMQKFL